jgi:hypothetical protein
MGNEVTYVGSMKMSAVREELIERFDKLNEEKQQKVLEIVRSMEEPKFSHEDWLKRVEKFQAELRAQYGDDFRTDVQSLLDEVREEPTDERLGRT